MLPRRTPRSTSIYAILVKTTNAFEQVKKNLANATVLAHPSHNAQTRLVTDAFNYGICASLEQLLVGAWKPLAFFTRKFSPPQRFYSAYDRELTAMYEAVRNVRYFLEGQHFTIITDHKLLVHMFTQRSEKASPRQKRQVSYIWQFTTDIAYVPGPENLVADSRSRSNSLSYRL